jgi:response regulator RpfG family c-di-GMP phosphodiesterase
MAMDSCPKHCVLVVDDEPDVCDSVHDLLRREYRVLRANTANDGFRLMQDEEVHIVLTDQRMPRTTGVEFLTSARSQHPRAVRLLFTGFADLDSIVAAINQGHVFQFLKKPWNPEDLLDAVRLAAQEYDRLAEHERESHSLRDEVEQLRSRVDELEHEVRRLGGAVPPSAAHRPS